MSGHVCHSVIE